MAPGQRVYQALGCSNCHALNGIGGTSGPDLSHEGTKRDKTWLVGHFKDPTALVPNSAMPPVTAPDADLEQLADYLLTLK
jgi:cbb3-type cytochrome oxidase cytochrome c subunit